MINNEWDGILRTKANEKYIGLEKIRRAKDGTGPPISFINAQLEMMNEDFRIDEITGEYIDFHRRLKWWQWFQWWRWI